MQSRLYLARSDGSIAVLDKGNLRKCPFCTELIKPEARVCRDCGREIELVCAIAEEMSLEALQKSHHPSLPPGESVPFQAAKELGRPCKYCCPPDRATRDRLGISPYGDTPEDNEKREAYWLEQLEKLGLFPCLFVLGSSHVTSFSNLLKKSGYKAEIVHAEWWPHS